MYHAGKPLAHRTPKKNLFGSAATVRPQVFPNEATAFHPWLPQRSRRARLCAWAARKLPSGAAWRMQMAGVACGIRAPSGHSHCVQVAAATPWTLHCLSNRSNECPTVARICLSMSSCSECDGPDRVLPGLIQLPARDGAYKSRCSVLDVMEASTRLINAVPPDVVLAACRALRMAAAAITYLLRSVDVGAQAPTPALGKMASWPSCAMRCAKIQVESTGPCSRCCCLVSQNH